MAINIKVYVWIPRRINLYAINIAKLSIGFSCCSLVLIILRMYKLWASDIELVLRQLSIQEIVELQKSTHDRIVR